MNYKVIMSNFPTIKDVVNVAIVTMRSGIQVSRVELLDKVQIGAINLAKRQKLPKIPTFIFEFVDKEAYARDQTQIVQKIASEHNGFDFVFAKQLEEKKCNSGRYERRHFWACFAMKPNFEAFQKLNSTFVHSVEVFECDLALR